MPRRLPLLALAACLGCAAAQQVGREVARQTPGGRAVLKEWDRYARLADTLRKYHDSGVLGSDDVANVLYGAGVIKKPPSTAKGPRRAPPKTEPFPVPAYAGAYRWPLDAGVVSSEFGRRWGRRHEGIDIAADKDVPVYASAPGKVLYAGDRLRGYGNVVIVRHDQDTVTLYAHNDVLKVKERQRVKEGQVLALLGSTGRSTGPHVHFELRVANKPVDPRSRLPRSRF